MAIGGLISGIFGGNGGTKTAVNEQNKAAEANAALYRDIYAQNKQTLSPFVNAGTQATGAINALLGLTPTNAPVQAAPQTQTNPPATPFEFAPGSGFEGIRNMWASVMTKGQSGQQQIGTPPIAAQQASYLTPQQAFQNYQNSTGYQFRLNQGMNALNSGYAGAGSIKSGAAMKAAQEYGQGIASQEFNNYLSALGNQQGVGASAAGAQAGVSTNFANSLAGVNQTRADAISNAALLKQRNDSQAVNSLLGGLGGILGGSF